MKREYLGDSYDAVKRLWGALLSRWAPLYANPDFIPDNENLRQDFTHLTGIPMLPQRPEDRPDLFSILNDPDTGIRLPGEHNQTEGRTHIAITSIAEQLHTSNVRCVITFDQSDYRNHELGREEQRQAKMRHLQDSGCNAFYYLSHAPFLFATSDSKKHEELRRILTEAGIPARRIEDLREQPA